MPSTTSEGRFTAADGSLVALADCDTFYASCERVARPDLQGKPVVVLSNNDGCIVAMSREAGALGIPMGLPEFQIRGQLQRAGVTVFSSNYTLYGDLSHRVAQTWESVVPEVEIYSIDEAFLHLPGALAAQAVDVARLARHRVNAWVGLPVSVGIAPTKVLAKIATEARAKKNPEGIFDMSSCTDVDGLLEEIPVEGVWGIGRHGARKLRERSIRTARQLRDADPGMIRKLLTVEGLNIVMELRGIPSIGPEMPLNHQCIISSRSLGIKVWDADRLKEAVAWHAARAAEKLRGKGLVAGVVGVRIQTSRHSTDQPRHDETIQIHLQWPTSDTSVLIRAAQRGLENIYRKGYGYAKAMVMLLDLADPARLQEKLPGLGGNTAEEEAGRASLMTLVDKINRMHGRGSLIFAAQGLKARDWHMKRSRLSPCWTTEPREFLKVRGR